MIWSYTTGGNMFSSPAIANLGHPGPCLSPIQAFEAPLKPFQSPLEALQATEASLQAP